MDATHILCSSEISLERLQYAETLLSSFVDDFEEIYGESNMVFNVHLLSHLADCVRHIGPLFAYSNYSFEDNIGHLVSLHKGTTDVSTQICKKYLMERNLFHYIASSRHAQEYYEDIDSKNKFSACCAIGDSLLIGKADQRTTLSERERLFVHSKY